jgi:exopolysaccharide biosynthesis polyprenyl glycosylphosphotransferase
MWALAERDVSLLIKPMSLHVAGPRLQVRPVDGLPLLQIAHPQIAGLARTVKGAIDRTAAAVGLLLLAPVMLTLALLVIREDGGPVLYRQVRIGEDGKPFPMLKFRSMHVDADQRLAEVQALNVHPDGVHIAIVNDPRVTRIGRFIRRYSLDELPQLFNVLRGEMALVGPRPPLPSEVAAYPDHGWFRMAVRPGLTGLWQIQGAQRHHLSLDEALELDLRYVENWSLAYDMAILWKTVAVVLRGSGEVKPEPSRHRADQALPPIPGKLADPFPDLG